MATYKPYKEDPSQIPVINEDQVYFLQWCIQTWLEVKREWEYKFEFDSKPNLPVDISKSCLMYRLTVEGKPPLAIPPPTAYSAPWYSLVEEGKAGLTQSVFQSFYIHSKENEHYPQDHEYSHYRYFQNDGIDDYWGFANINQHIWLVLEADLFKYIVTYRNSKGERWVLRPITKKDKPIEGGRTMLEGGGTAPIYCDWILIREDLDDQSNTEGKDL